MIHWHALVGLAVLALLATGPEGGASAQLLRGARSPTPPPASQVPDLPMPSVIGPAPTPDAGRRTPDAVSSPSPEPGTVGSILRDGRLQDILRYETLLRENPQDDGVRQNLIQAAWSSDRRSVIVIGLGAPHRIRPMQRRAASVDCGRWFAYHQAWKSGTKKDFGSIRADIHAPYKLLLEELLPDGRFAIVRQYDFSE